MSVVAGTTEELCVLFVVGPDCGVLQLRSVGQQQPGVTAANPRSKLHDHTREHRVGCECCLSEVVVCIVGEYV